MNRKLDVQQFHRNLFRFLIVSMLVHIPADLTHLLTLVGTGVIMITET